MSNPTLTQPVLETFQLTGTALTFPPTVAWVSEFVQAHLPQDCQVLHWAIVKADPATRQLWIEGAIVKTL